MSPNYDALGLLSEKHYDGYSDDKPILHISTTQSLSKKCLHTLKATWQTIRPSFFTLSSPNPPTLRRTSYLDGLRGFAALIVYIQHHQLWAHAAIEAPKVFENAYGYQGKYFFSALPGIRTFFSGGHFAVTVFFVISGYVLSTKPLSLIQSGDLLKFGDNISSALFRRYLRLHIPVIATTFLYMTSWHAFGLWTPNEAKKANYFDELWSWYVELKNFSFVFRTGGEVWFTYNFHAWSIPVEMRGSIVIYTALMAFSRCTRNARLIGEVALMYYFMYIVDGAYFSMFMAGMLICDFELLALNNNLPRFFTRLAPFKKAIFTTLFVVSIWLSGVPSHSFELSTLRDSPGWKTLSYLKPQAVFDYKFFYLFFAASFLVSSIPHLPLLKSFFETRFCQYLGRISFAFYLVHGPIMWTIADRLYVAAGWSREEHAVGIPAWINAFPLPKAGPLGLELAFLLPHLLILPITLWTAEIGTKLLDDPSVKSTQWLYKKFTTRREEEIKSFA